MKKVALVGLPIIALIIGGILYGPGLYEAFVTGGEKTLTGGDAYHAPIQYRKKDSREAITEPEFVPAGELLISGGTKGIGVSIDGDSRFYPLYVLQYHQVINDKVGNSAIACSYWSSEQTLVVHETKGKVMGVSGAVKNGNLIMYDKATDTWYLQETGKAISEKTGLPLQGTQNDGRLIELDDSMRTLNVRWDVWSKEHPDSKVLFCDHCETEHSKH